MKLPLLASTLFLASVLPSCAVDPGKGEEEDAMEFYENDSKDDSFRHPTEHGDLIFGVPQSAAMLEDLSNTQFLFSVKRGSNEAQYDCREL